MNKLGQNTDQPAIYFNKLYMKNVRCFKGNHEIDLGNGKGEPSQWTVILGNNNVGKTTILRVIASLELDSKKKRSGIDDDDPGWFELKSSTLLPLERYKSINSDMFFIGNSLFSFPNQTEKYKNLNFKDNSKGMEFYSTKISREDIDWIDNNIFSFFFRNKIFSATDVANSLLLEQIKLLCYGTSRMMIDSQTIQGENTQGLFDNKTLLSNVEEWLKELHFAATNNLKQAEIRYKQVEQILCGGLLPEVSQIRITTIPDKSSFETFPEFLTSQGWVRLEDLGYGYQATLAWVADLAKRMFDQYPDLENPLHGPAVVLVDEIDLHLHPEWQRKIIKYLSDLFPNTQFIVTAHSPLIIQSVENVNLIMLEKDDNPDGKGIHIRQRFGSFQGWTVDEILTELMNLGDRTRSDLYLQLMQDFEDAVLNDDYEKAQNVYDQLDTILSPSSYQRKVLQIQMSSLIPVGV